MLDMEDDDTLTHPLVLVRKGRRMIPMFVLNGERMEVEISLMGPGSLESR
jgi:hypothetical protein